ncbi:MAG TPA: DUF4124 domain-containing protein [Burkholderiaceae bacterium]|nr:DUF4124 domain-containing protein [Burkholderiaceae bacterium]
MLRPCVAAFLGLALLGSAVGAEPVFRCEGKDGRVTYSDSPCPSDSRTARKLDEAPPVSTAAGKEAPRDAREAGQIAQSRTGTPDALQESRQLDEQIAATRRECADLSRSVEYAKQDLDAATPNQRSTAELALRRAQDQYALICPHK